MCGLRRLNVNKRPLIEYKSAEWHTSAISYITFENKIYNYSPDSIYRAIKFTRDNFDYPYVGAAAVVVYYYESLSELERLLLGVTYEDC